MPASNSFYKHYPNRKDWRKPYYDCRRFDSSCCSHGGCSYCRDSRLRYRHLIDDIMRDMMAEYYEYEDYEVIS